jgi:hypothetical protein
MIIKNRFSLVFACLLPLFLLTGCASFFHRAAPPMPPPPEIQAQADGFVRQTKGLDPKVARSALDSYYRALSKGIGRSDKLAIVDYSKPSTQQRFWVFDMRTHRLLYQELVAHGKNSVNSKDVKYASRFSDKNGSLQSSIGLYRTAREHYMGKHGYSLRLTGLESGFNGNAMERAIVIHGAHYVSEKFARDQGRLGLSWGCPALSLAVHREVIDHLKGGNLVFAYYPDQNWLRQSRFLNG